MLSCHCAPDAVRDAQMARRQEAGQRSGFDLKRWHTAAVGLGAIGLGGLTEAPFPETRHFK
ncbi:hypothetical protein AB0M44_04515 [Streptosporangium subroseum]|uniref:hypothetical protein n=1 Tax=Streptosporangium subroseum TaxID=106412 RepID=UPI00343CC8E7